MSKRQACTAQSIPLPAQTLSPILEALLTHGQSAVITVTGNSMRPFLRHMRDQVVLVPFDPNTLRRGDIVLYRRLGGQYVLHRIYSVQNGMLTLIGDAQWTLETGVTAQQVLARAAKVRRNGRELSCDRGWWRWLMQVYLYRMKAPRLCRAMIRYLFIYPRAAWKRFFTTQKAEY